MRRCGMGLSICHYRKQKQHKRSGGRTINLRCVWIFDSSEQLETGPAPPRSVIDTFSGAGGLKETSTCCTNGCHFNTVATERHLTTLVFFHFPMNGAMNSLSSRHKFVRNSSSSPLSILGSGRRCNSRWHVFLTRLPNPSRSEGGLLVVPKTTDDENHCRIYTPITTMQLHRVQ